MCRPAIIRILSAVFLIGCLAAGVRWLWTTPLAPIHSRASIGTLNLEQTSAELQVRFTPPKSLSSITILFQKPTLVSGKYCAHPDFPLALRVRADEAGGTNIIRELITKDRMQWTSWHNGPSLLLMLDGSLGRRLSSDREYDLTLSVESAVGDLGQAEVFLHWMDGAYVWGRESQKLLYARRPTK